MKASKLIHIIKGFNFSGISFVSIKGYSSDSSGNTEVADYLLNVGISYASMQQKNLVKLQAAVAKDLANEQFDLGLIKEAIESLITSITAPSATRSTAQAQAWIKLNESGTIKICKETEEVSIFAVRVRKTVTQKGVYKEVKSRPLTLAKRYVEKTLSLMKPQYFKLSNTGSVKVSGDTIEINA